MFVRDYPNKNRGLLGSIKWLAFCYIISGTDPRILLTKWEAREDFFGAIVRICPQADSDMWAKGWDGSPVHLLKN